jgi:diguanylate cyclase (GGDEF)-like protein
LKEIYESLGEEEGNHILNRAARHLRSAMSGLHLLARADRDTIEVMLPEAGKDTALAVATEIREKLGRLAIRLRGEPDREIHLTPFIGLATCPDDARSAEFLISEAQQALYVAVTDGRKLVDSGTAREEVQARLMGQTGRYVFRSAEMIEILETVDRIAASDVPILVRGETGVGKEVLAELVHERSARHGKPLIKVNCAALPDSLLESELFGYERGAFTGADRRKPGRFELAQGGTIFLDEIGEIPPTTQVKLLRVLQDHRVERLGGTGPISVDVRVIAATNIDLPAAIRASRFREDLYYRLNVVSLVIPPLRARKEEIPDLVDQFVESYTKTNETTATTLSPAAMDKLFAHVWPGNVRELKNTIERALVISRDEEVQADEIVFPEATAEEPATPERPAAPRPEKTSVPHALNDRQRRLMEIMATRESITTREYAAIVGVSVRTGNRDLAELIELGLIVKIGKRRAAIYRLPE